MEHLELSGSLKLVDDVLLIPLAELPAESRARLEGSDDDVAISRVQSRSGSKIIDASAASLLSRFREPRTVVDAVILFSREHRLDPDEVLEGAFPLLRSLVDGGFLAPADRPGGEGAVGVPLWGPGAELLGGRVERTLQLLDDTEVALLARGGRRSVLKLARQFSSPLAGQSLGDAPGAATGRQLRHEARFLDHLGGDLAPALLGEGETDGHAYLEIELLLGVEVSVAAAEWRDRGLAGRGALLELLRAIVDVYAELHRRGVAHGDVHPRNLLVDRSDRVRPIDFGVARALDPESALPAPGGRGGVPFFYEPELAHAALDGVAPPPASAAGEQFAVAALLYCLATGTHRRDFSLARESMLREIAEAPPLPFRERGTDPWPELEAVLGRALALRPEERFASLAELSDALAAIAGMTSSGATRGSRPTPSRSALDRHLAEAIASARLDGPWLAQGLSPAPTISVNYGAAGLAAGLRQIAERHDDSSLLTAADVWARRAARGLDRDDAFYNAEIQITREVVGESSLYHSPSGVHAAAALVARALGDPVTQSAAVERFLAASERPAAGLDLTLGRTSTLLGAAILLDALPESSGSVERGGIDDGPLRRCGEHELAALWAELDRLPEMARAEVEYLGIAHGWAGFLYGTLQWCEIAEAPIPSGVERRLDELAAFARSAGRGLQWPWVLRPGAESTTMPGWCSGSCGYLFLWTAAHRRFGRSRDLDLAIGAAWDAWDAPESPITLCCGLAGRSYALLNLYRHTRETVWLDRARDLALRAARTEKPPVDYPHSLYKGAFGLAVLAADLERPDESAMPLFEPAGFRAARRARREPA